MHGPSIFGDKIIFCLFLTTSFQASNAVYCPELYAPMVFSHNDDVLGQYPKNARCVPNKIEHLSLYGINEYFVLNQKDKMLWIDNIKKI